MAHPTVSSAYLKILLDGAQVRGVSFDDVVNRLGLEGLIDEPETRIPYSKAQLLWEIVAKRSQDPAFGLELAQTLQPGAFWVLDYAVRNAPTLRAAYVTLARYCHLVHDGSQVTMEERSKEATVGYTLPLIPRGSPRHAAEFAIASWVVTGRQMTDSYFAPIAVRFQHPKPDSIRAHRQLFGTDVIEFCAPNNAIVLPISVLERPIRRPDPNLCSIADRYAKRLIEQLSTSHEFATQVRQSIAENIRAGIPASVESTAQALHMTSRTLQRRLTRQHCSHQVLVDEVRAQLAQSYLAEPSVSIAEVAFLLGFSEQSSFSRAFRRWTSITPAEFRQKRSA